VTDLPECILQGEVVKCNFKIQNIGRVTASGMVIKSSVPWLYNGEVFVPISCVCVKNFLSTCYLQMAYT
jgi:hypothetical protein